MALVLACFIVALGLALTGMQSAKNRFAQFVDVDQQVLQNATSLYAQGLQIGQALRNIVLDPGNERAYQNLDAATAEFDAVMKLSMPLGASDPALASVLQGTADGQKKRLPILKKTAELAKTDRAAAITLLNDNDTPIWREMRAPLAGSRQAQER